MDFPTYFRILKKYLGDGATIPEFFRELIEMITEDDAEEIISASGITSEKTDNTLVSYAKRSFSKKMANQLLYRVNSANMTESIESRPDETIQLLANEFNTYYPDITAENASQRIPEIFVDFIREKAGMGISTTAQKATFINQSNQLKKQYGQFLLTEANNCCAFPGCDRPLILTRGGLASENYEVSTIEKDKDAEPLNLIALCPDCFLTYQAESRKKIVTALKNVKKILVSAHNSHRPISELKLDNGIVAVLTSLNKLKYDEYDISYDPKKLTDKISPENNRTLYQMVKNQVIDNYLTIQKIIVNLDKQGKIDYEEIQYQMRSMYKKLKASKHDNLAIFNTISEKIHKATLQDTYFCQAIVSYFIQKCEVLE
ncbi:ABC-three component system protein [Streptococcus anginosus]|uniref:ABC-three component system protein n=1 Tax=Streptococcus anginosus TaxID=1328 RepID=UPI0030101E03